MIKYMTKYGLNSAYAAAMVIARRALGFNERIPREYGILLGVGQPEDCPTRNWSLWGKICKLLSEQKISRHQMFTQAKVLEVLLEAVSKTKKTKKQSRKKRKVKSTSLSVVSVDISTTGESPMPQTC